jgi:hypothetical protein
VHRPSPPNTYSYVREENSGSTGKFVQNYLLITCIPNLFLAIHTQSVNGLKEPLSLGQRSGEKFLQPTRSGCLLTWNWSVLVPVADVLLLQDLLFWSKILL